GLAVDETRARQGGAHRRGLVGRKHMADHDLHPGSSACRHDRRAPSNTQSRPPGKHPHRGRPRGVAGTVQNYDVTGRIRAEIICIRRGAEMAMWHPRRKRGRWISGGLSRPSARLGSSSGFHMKTKRKIWLGVGAFVIAGAGAAGVAGPLAAPTTHGPRALPGAATETAIPLTAGRIVVAEHAAHGKDAGEGGESKGLADLPPDLGFAARVALLRGHLLVGDELVRQQQWNAAL